MGNKELAQKYIHAAHGEWIKELDASRRYAFLNRYNNDIWKYFPEKRLKEIIDDFFKSVKAEIRKSKQESFEESF